MRGSAGMIWLIVVAAGIGLLAGFFALRVPFLVLASIVTVAAGVALTPAGWWPLWGAVTVVAILCALQLAYLMGYLVACAVAQLRAAAEQRSERLDAGYGG